MPSAVCGDFKKSEGGGECLTATVVSQIDVAGQEKYIFNQSCCVLKRFALTCTIKTDEMTSCQVSIIPSTYGSRRTIGKRSEEKSSAFAIA
jgi:hypothetical protein